MHIVIYVVCKDVKEAKRIAEATVQERLAACANILPSMTSIYRWQNVVQSSREVVLLLKTQKPHFQAAKKLILKAHSYELPCITAIPIQQGHKPYLSWLTEETSIRSKPVRRVKTKSKRQKS